MRFIHQVFLILTMILILSPQRAWSYDEKDPLSVQVQSEPSTWNHGQQGRLVFRLSLPKKFHAYVDMFSARVLQPDGFLQGSLKIENAHEFHDKFSKKTRLGFQGDGLATLAVEAPLIWHQAGDQMKIEFVYQACSDTYCLFPVTKTLSTPIQLVGPVEAAQQSTRPVVEAAKETAPRPVDWLSTEQLEQILGDSKFMALFFVFLAGILTSFTPCIFPMIPITLAVLGNGSESRSRAQNFLLSVFYVLGIATTYSLLGIAAASSGALFGASLGSPWVLGTICVLFFVMSLSMYGLFEIQVPAFLRNSLGNRKTAPGAFGAYLSGLIAGVVASPCVGPVLVAILAWVATTGSKFFGFFLLFSYALGLGLIFLILGAFTELTRKLPRSGPWLDGIKFVMGSLMLGVFYYYLGLLLPMRWHDGALAIGLIVIGSLYGAFIPLKNSTALAKVRKGLSQAVLIVGIGYMILSVFDLRPMLHQNMISPTGAAKVDLKWKTYSEEELARATREGKPIIIDFWAEWCAACHELEDLTFPDPRVIQETEKFVLLRFDATQDTAVLRELKTRWKIQGLPTVLFIDAQGKWNEELTLTEFEKPDRFLERIRRLSSPAITQ